MMGFAETDEVWQTYLRAFRERLRDLAEPKDKTSSSNIGLPAKASNAHGSSPTKLLSRANGLVTRKSYQVVRRDVQIARPIRSPCRRELAPIPEL